jgi:RNA polymerase sigma-70 factor (ECF subfamily)
VQNLESFLRNRQKELLELLDRSGATLYVLLTRLTLREDIAEELMQDLFIKLSNARCSNDIRDMDLYARRAAINLAFDWRRKRKYKTVPLELVNEPVSNVSSPLAELIQAEQFQELLDAVGRLNETSREVLVMRHIQQESYDYIAGQLGKTAHQVRALCSKAVSSLRDLTSQNKQPSSQKEVQDVEER